MRVAIDENDGNELAGKLWEALNDDNKVSLFVRTITLETGDYEDHHPEQIQRSGG